MATGTLSQAARYICVIVIGLSLDLSLTLAVAQVGGLPLPVAAAIGFVTALALNYVLFEFWVFRDQTAAVSKVRLTQTATAACLALAVRVGVVWAVARLIDQSAPGMLVTMLLGVGASFVINFLLLRVVFARQAKPIGDSAPQRTPP